LRFLLRFRRRNTFAAFRHLAFTTYRRREKRNQKNSHDFPRNSDRFSTLWSLWSLFLVGWRYLPVDRRLNEVWNSPKS
jgi:hypothetical protein